MNVWNESISFFLWKLNSFFMPSVKYITDSNVTEAHEYGKAESIENYKLKNLQHIFIVLWFLFASQNSKKDRIIRLNYHIQNGQHSSRILYFFTYMSRDHSKKLIRWLNKKNLKSFKIRRRIVQFYHDNVWHCFCMVYLQS